MLLRVGLPAKPIVARPRAAVNLRPTPQIRPSVLVRAIAEPPVAPVDTALDDAAGPSEPGNGAEATATRRFIRGSPNKVRRVLNVVRGRTYEDALRILTFLPYRATEPCLDLLLSCGANAKQNLGLRKSRLFVSACYCDEGPMFKRFQPRAQGRACKIRKRTSHITIKLKELE